MFQQFLADVRAHGTPSAVELVRSDGRGEFERNYAELSGIHSIKYECIIGNSPEFNGIAVRALGLIDATARAVIFQARELYPHAQLPSMELLRAESYRRACNDFNHSAAASNPTGNNRIKRVGGRNATRISRVEGYWHI